MTVYLVEKIMAKLQLRPEIIMERLALLAQAVPNLSKIRTTSVCGFFFLHILLPSLFLFSVKILSSFLSWSVFFFNSKNA